MARRHDQIDERPDLAALEKRVGDAVEAAAGPASVRARPIHAAEQALDAQHVGPRALREPLPQQLRRRIDALRIGRVLFAVGCRRGPVEDEVGAVVDEGGVDRRRPARASDRTPNALTASAATGVVLGIVDRVVGGAVDDHAGTEVGHRRANAGLVGDVEIGAGQRRNLVLRRERPRHRPAELPARAGDQRPHRERSFTMARVSQSICRRLMVSRLS